MTMREKYFVLFMEGLRKAGKRMNDPHYFQLPVASKERGRKVFRERVYCYELYHQLRIILGDSFPHKLHGEVDKAGHEFIPGAKKPDFIVHDPGNMENNLVVIEVKHIRTGMSELKDDLETLRLFLSEGYYRAILLVYGDDEQGLPNTIQSEVVKASKRCGDRILLVWHRGWRREPEVLY